MGHWKGCFRGWWVVGGTRGERTEARKRLLVRAAVCCRSAGPCRPWVRVAQVTAVFGHSPGGWKSTAKTFVGSVSSGGREGGCVPVSVLAWLATVFPISVHVVPFPQVCLCVLRSGPTLVTSSSQATSALTLFPDVDPPEALGGRPSACESREDAIPPVSASYLYLPRALVKP